MSKTIYFFKLLNIFINKCNTYRKIIGKHSRILFFTLWGQFAILFIKQTLQILMLFVSFNSDTTGITSGARYLYNYETNIISSSILIFVAVHFVTVFLLFYLRIDFRSCFSFVLSLCVWTCVKFPLFIFHPFHAKLKEAHEIAFLIILLWLYWRKLVVSETGIHFLQQICR